MRSTSDFNEVFLKKIFNYFPEAKIEKKNLKKVRCLRNKKDSI